MNPSPVKGIRITKSPMDVDTRSLADYLDDIKDIPVLGKDEEVGLMERIAQGSQAARDRLVTANLRFVITVAKQFQDRGVSMEDLIQEGNIGLMRAIDHFDPTKRMRFSTYAVYWIKHAVIKAVYDASSTIRVPISKRLEMHKSYRLLNKLEPHSDDVDVMAEMDEIENDVIYQTVMMAWNVTSMDDTPQDDNANGTTYSAMIPDEESASTDDGVIERDVCEYINRALDDSSPRKAAVVRKAFGIDSPQMTYREIGKEMGISAERARQLKRDMVRKLRRRLPKSLND